MRGTIEDLALALVDGIAREEAIADRLGALSREADAAGAAEFGTAFRTVARLHRVATIRNRAQLGALAVRVKEDDP